MTAIGPKECPNAVKDRTCKGGFVGHGVEGRWYQVRHGILFVHVGEA